MVQIIFITYCCILLPLLLMCGLLDKKNRLCFIYLLIGMTSALIAAVINGLLIAYLQDFRYVSTTLAPIIEELLKALPVLFYLFVLSDHKQTVIFIAFASGIGFAVFENVIIIVQNLQSLTLSWCFVRGIGASLMHGLCPTMIASIVLYAKPRKKLLWSALFASLLIIMMYHGIYNSLILSGKLYYLGLWFPLIMDICVYLFIRRLSRISK